MSWRNTRCHRRTHRATGGEAEKWPGERNAARLALASAAAVRGIEGGGGYSDGGIAEHPRHLANVRANVRAWDRWPSYGRKRYVGQREANALAELRCFTRISKALDPQLFLVAPDNQKSGNTIPRIVTAGLRLHRVFPRSTRATPLLLLPLFYGSGN